MDNDAFPWFDDYRWAWAFDQNAEAAPAYRIRPAPPNAKGTIQIFMSTASHEQSESVKAWLYREFRPLYEVPATKLLMAIGDRSATNNPAWSHLQVSQRQGGA